MIYIDYDQLASFNLDFSFDFAIGGGVESTLDIPKTKITEQ